ncbi:MAG TPA: hypothetical protein VGM67_05690 [Gemmatimonadaceae bacterium]|jgi:hypothetical protein
MTAVSEGEAFRFETSYDTAGGLPEPKVAGRSKHRGVEDQLFIAFAIFGALCLIWRYTIALGVGVIVATTFLWTMRERSLARRRRLAPVIEPRERVSIRVSEAGYSMRGDDFLAETTWNRLINGFESDGYLLVQAWRVPRVYLPVDEMKRAGVYDRVKEIVEAKTAAHHNALAEARAGQT